MLTRGIESSRLSGSFRQQKTGRGGPSRSLALAFSLMAYLWKLPAMTP